MNHAETPLLASVGNVERGDGRAGVVGELRAEEGDERAAPQFTERAVGRGWRAVAIDVPGCARIRVNRILLIVSSATASLGNIPTCGKRSIRRRSRRVRQCVKVLRDRDSRGCQTYAASSCVGHDFLD